MHGRIKKEDKIDYTCGIVLEKKIGEKVNIEDILAYIHSNKEERIEEAIQKVYEAYTIGQKQNKYEHILEII